MNWLEGRSDVTELGTIMELCHVYVLLYCIIMYRISRMPPSPSAVNCITYAREEVMALTYADLLDHLLAGAYHHLCPLYHHASPTCISCVE